MGRVTQEFYCNDCLGFFFVRLNLSLNHNVGISCPNCGHKHPRCIKDGLVYEISLGAHVPYDEEIVVPKSAYHKEPAVAAVNSRGGVPVDMFLRARWLETVRK